MLLHQSSAFSGALQDKITRKAGELPARQFPGPQKESFLFHHSGQDAQKSGAVRFLLTGALEHAGQSDHVLDVQPVA